MKLGINFDDYEVSEFELLPEGDYVVVIDDTNLKENKNGTGNYLKVDYKVAQGKWSGRRLSSFFNINHENEQTQDIGRQQLKELILACGLSPKNFDTNQLHGVTVSVRVAVDGEWNRVKRVMKATDTPKVPVTESTGNKSNYVPF